MLAQLYESFAVAAPLCTIPLLIVIIVFLAIKLILPTEKQDSSLAKIFTKPTKQQDSSLLRLPAEIRTQIWLYAIPHTVTNTKSDPVPHIPPMALACRQTLAETLPIYLYNTEFCFDIQDHDGSFTCDSVTRLLTQTSRAGPQTSPLKFRFILGGRPNWDHQLAWAKIVHGGGYWSSVKGSAEAGNALAGLRVAHRLRVLPWEEVKAVLEELPVAKAQGR